MLELGLKFDLRAPAFGASAGDLYEAALDQAAWADAEGFRLVRFMEHHGSDDGYCPSPLSMAAAVAARTQHIRIRVQALVLPLHDPVRVAEDVAVIDQISRGRLELVIGAGYVPEEFQMFGRRLEDRPRLVEIGVAALRSAWTGEPFTYEGRPARVALRPFQESGPPLILGGSSPGAARRAARIADGFFPTSGSLVRIYTEECERLGRLPGRTPRRGPKAAFVFVARDPEAAWAQLEPHVMHEMNAYGEWLQRAGITGGFRPVDDLAELRATGLYRVLAPDEFMEMARDLYPDGKVEFHPLVGGLDPAVGWESLELLADEVLPRLREEGLIAQAPAFATAIGGGPRRPRGGE